jgi:hypothetical protein
MVRKNAHIKTEYLLTIATRMKRSSAPSLEMRYLNQSLAITQVEARIHVARLVPSSLEATGKSDWPCRDVELIDQ